MATTYRLPTDPVRISLGRAGLATVRASVPFRMGEEFFCADHAQVIDTGRRTAIFYALGQAPGVIRIAPQWR